MTTNVFEKKPVAEWPLQGRANILFALVLLDWRNRIEWGKEGARILPAPPSDPYRISDYEAENFTMAIKSPMWEQFNPMTWPDRRKMKDLWLLNIAYGHLDRKRKAGIEAGQVKLPGVLVKWIGDRLNLNRRGPGRRK